MAHNGQPRTGYSKTTFQNEGDEKTFSDKHMRERY